MQSEVSHRDHDTQKTKHKNDVLVKSLAAETRDKHERTALEQSVGMEPAMKMCVPAEQKQADFAIFIRVGLYLEEES